MSQPSEDHVRNILWWKELARFATSKAKDYEYSVRKHFADTGLEAVDIGPFVVKSTYSTVDWDSDIIDTIKSIDGVSDTDKTKIFKKQKPKVDGLHVNKIAKKYGGSVADRVKEARKETGITFKIDADRSEHYLISDSVKEWVDDQDKKINSENEENL